MFSCEEITRLFSESLERKLPMHQRLQMHLHMLLCHYCSRFRKQIEFLRDLARRTIHTSRSGSQAEHAVKSKSP